MQKECARKICIFHSIEVKHLFYKFIKLNLFIFCVILFPFAINYKQIVSFLKNSSTMKKGHTAFKTAAK